MCGIAGYIDFRKKSTEETVRSMISPMNHRGPDGDGTLCIDGNNWRIGLGHKRLSIIDLSETGKQPMSFNDLHITFNGEIYNYQEVKSELAKKGHTFIGHSDTEMILHAYKEWGVSCVDRFIGMFAIVIVDVLKDQVICLRDRAGVKPFYYYFKDDLFLFSSELKAFHEHPDFQKEINIDAVAAYMQYGSVPTPHCIFNYCSKLMPGSYMTIDLESKQMNESEYWNIYDHYNKDKLSLSYEEAKTETKSLLTSAFNYRMVADVPVGVFLSGGFDSTCVTSILQSERTQKLKTFTIGVPDIGLNEAPYAKDIAKHLGTDHTEINCTEKEAIELIPSLPFFYDEPFADSSAIPTTLVSKMARQDVTVALSADGGDEIFAGYNRYDYIQRYGDKLNKIPGFVRNTTVALMQKISSQNIPVMRNKYNFHNRYEKLKGVLKDPSDQNIMLSLSQQFTNDQMKDLMQKDFGMLDNLYMSDKLTSGYSPLSYMMAIDFQTYMLDDILQKVDRATMSQSLEGREPLLDHRIAEFAAQLPDNYKYENGVKKRILRDIVYDYVPKELLDRPKMGFAIPIGKWLTNELKDLVETHLNEQLIKEQNIFNWTYIRNIKESFYKGKMEYDAKLWYILMFQMWYARWMT